MKKSKKILLRVIPIVMVLMVVITTSVFASSPIKPNTPSNGTASSTISGTAGNIWQTVIIIIQILAVAAIIIAGVRYMFASADTKADIKKQMVILVIGAVLVFGATTIINLIISATGELVK